MPGDCCECGACCFSDSDAYVEVTEDDIERFGDLASTAVSQVDGKHYLTMRDGRCAQLEFAEGAWVCGVYKKRPAACRALQRGSPPCMAERTLKLIRVRRAAKRLTD